MASLSLFLFLAFLAIAAKGQHHQHQRPNDDDLISPCVQNKLKLSQQVQHKAFKDELKGLAPAARLAARLCSDKFDDVTGQLFTMLTTPSSRSESAANLDYHAVQCYQWHLITNHPERPIVRQLTGSVEQFVISDCDAIVQAARDNYKKQSPSNGTPEDLACIDKIIERFTVERFVTVVILRFGDRLPASSDAIELERKIFGDRLKEITEELVACYVKNANE
jgi:hypothetical protein